MDIAYGIKVSEINDPYVLTAEEAMNGIAEAVIPGNFLVDMLPILKYIPSWMPGASFKRKAAHWRRVNADMSDKPCEHVKESLVSSTSLDNSIPHIDTQLWYLASGGCSAVTCGDID